MSSDGNPIVSATSFNPNKDVGYAKSKTNKSGGKSVNITNTTTGQTLYLSTPLMLTWGAQMFADEHTGRKSYTMSLQFPRDDYKNEQTDQFLEVMKDFEEGYIRMLVSAMKYGLKTTVCTIYHPCFDKGESDRIESLLTFGLKLPQLQKKAITGLTIFNDIILQEAVNFGVPVMDLRLIFSEDRDYANAIEPSAAGGSKMANIIKEIVHDHDFSLSNTVVFK